MTFATMLFASSLLFSVMFSYRGKCHDIFRMELLFMYVNESEKEA